MRSLAALLIAATFAASAQADPVSFAYAWEAGFVPSPGSPLEFQPTTGGELGSVTFSPAAGGSASVILMAGAGVAAAAFTFTPPAGASPTVQIEDSTLVKLTLTDSASGQSGVLTFAGHVGQQPDDNLLFATFDGPLMQELMLGVHHYVVWLNPEGTAIPMNGDPLGVRATVAVMETPEPGTLVLAALGVVGMIARRRLSRRSSGGE